MLPPARLIEAIECYQMLDEVAGQPVPPGQLREIVNREIETLPGHYARVSFDLLWMEYLEYLREALPKMATQLNKLSAHSSSFAGLLAKLWRKDKTHQAIARVNPKNRKIYTINIDLFLEGRFLHASTLRLPPDASPLPRDELRGTWRGAARM
jgi:hypothetical protein